MSETFTPAQDLATLDRVAVIASEAGLMSSDLAVLLERLREPIVTQQKRHRALSAALAAEWKWDDSLSAEAERAVDRILAAIAVAGAQIVWPSPEASADERADWEKVLDEGHPDCILAHPHPPGCLPVSKPEPTAREKILAEVAACDARSDFAAPYQIRNEATRVAQARQENDEGVPVLSRANLIRAAALLVLAVDRMDCDR